MSSDLGQSLERMLRIPVSVHEGCASVPDLTPLAAVIPAKAGIQRRAGMTCGACAVGLRAVLDSRLRGNDGEEGFLLFRDNLKSKIQNPKLTCGRVKAGLFDDAVEVMKQ